MTAPAPHRWVALLRGVNVGGHRKIPMADLRALAARHGLAAPVTHLASGNLVFSSAAPAPALATTLRDALADELGVPDVVVLLRDRDDLDAIIAANPFPDAVAAPSRLFVHFLADAPRPEAALALAAAASAPEVAAVRGREAYLHLPVGAGASKLPTRLERLLGVTATARNWNTVLALRALLGG